MEDIPDLLSGLNEAFTDSLRTLSFTPLLKQELKSKIQISRLKRGEDELKVDFNPKPSYKLREDEVQRQARRREVNRKAAVKFRQKRRNHVKDLEDKVKKLEEENKVLLEEIEQWKNTHKNHKIECSKQVSSPEENAGYTWVILVPET